MDSKDTVIRLENVSFAYRPSDGVENLVLKDINFQVAAGDFMGIIGPNGGGKSTLLKLILGLLRPQRGTVEVLGRRPANVSKSVGYVPQSSLLRRNFPITVEDAVLMGRMGESPWRIRYNDEDRAKAAQMMDRLGILPFRRRTMVELSGGQLQRVLIARALVTDPQILLLDEPTANLDSESEAGLFDILNDLISKITILVVSHDIAFISHYIKKVACVCKTLVCHNTSTLREVDLQKIYSHTVCAIDHQSDSNKRGRL